MELTEILTFVTILVTWVLGWASKKSTFIKNELIPLQNILVGVIIALIEWAITKDFSTAIALSGVLAGGLYDIPNNFKKILQK